MKKIILVFVLLSFSLNAGFSDVIFPWKKNTQKYLTIRKSIEVDALSGRFQDALKKISSECSEDMIEMLKERIESVEDQKTIEKLKAILHLT